MDHNERVAKEAMVNLCADVALEFARDNKTLRPLLAVLTRSRREAIGSMAALVTVDADKPSDVRKLQNEVQRFLDMIAYTRKIVDTGLEVRSELEEEDREDAEKIREEIERDNEDDEA